MVRHARRSCTVAQRAARSWCCAHECMNSTMPALCLALSGARLSECADSLVAARDQLVGSELPMGYQAPLYSRVLA